MYYAMRTQKYLRCYYITIFAIFLGLFPYLYFAMGGYKGGVTTFFVFAIVFTAFMFEKKQAHIILTLELFVYTTCIVASFLHPGLVKNFPDESGFFFNNIVDFTVVSISLAMIALAHFRLYNEQQKKLDGQNTVLAHASRAKTAFLANTSHEMRTPLTIISVNVQTVMEILEDMSDVLKDQDAGKLLETAQREIMRLARMVGGMLNLASMSESGEKKMVDFSALLANSAEMLRLSLQNSGNSLVTGIESALNVFGSADLLAQVLTNILQNAGQHTENGTITLSAKKNGGIITVSIADTGSGVSADILPQVFERGVSDGGTGFGLYLCKTVVESHGGNIWIESEQGNGTTVYFSLPVYEGQLPILPNELGELQQ